MRCTRADLERIVMHQLENLDAMNELLNLMKIQNELVQKANKKLQNDILKLKRKDYARVVQKRQL